MTEKTIYAALAKAQSEMGKALKQSENLHFKSKYADLGAVMDACMPALTKHGIAVVQPMVSGELGHAVKTVLLHESGESIETSVPLLFGKNDMQGLGSAITYARRYGLMCLAGIAPEDDDGNAAVTSQVVGQPMAKSWAQTVIDETCGANATEAEKAGEIAKAIIGQFGRKKTKAQLEAEWDRRKSLIESLRDRFPAKFSEVCDAYQRREEEIAPPDPDKMPEVA